MLRVCYMTPIIRCILLVVVYVIPLFLVRRTLSINTMYYGDVIGGILIKVSFLGHLQ